MEFKNMNGFGDNSPSVSNAQYTLSKSMSDNLNSLGQLYRNTRLPNRLKQASHTREYFNQTTKLDRRFMINMWLRRSRNTVRRRSILPLLSILGDMEDGYAYSSVGITKELVLRAITELLIAAADTDILNKIEKGEYTLDRILLDPNIKIKIGYMDTDLLKYVVLSNDSAYFTIGKQFAKQVLGEHKASSLRKYTDEELSDNTRNFIERVKTNEQQRVLKRKFAEYINNYSFEVKSGVSLYEAKHIIDIADSVYRKGFKFHLGYGKIIVSNKFYKYCIDKNYRIDRQYNYAEIYCINSDYRLVPFKFEQSPSPISPSTNDNASYKDKDLMTNEEEFREVLDKPSVPSNTYDYPEPVAPENYVPIETSYGNVAFIPPIDEPNTSTEKMSDSSFSFIRTQEPENLESPSLRESINDKGVRALKVEPPVMSAPHSSVPSDEDLTKIAKYVGVDPHALLKAFVYKDILDKEHR